MTAIDVDRPAPSTRHRTGRWIEHWEPEDQAFWENGGSKVARRNLVWSILAEHVGFSVWMLWSVSAVYLVQAGFAFSVDQLFWLAAVPSLVGATMRFPYTFAVARFGGRNWTVVSASLLLVPCALLVVCVSNPATPYWMFVLAAVTAGLGGGNFASSMANISYFYPDARKGWALGLNAAGGNIGVSTVQLITPFVVGLSVLGAASAVNLENVALVWAPLAVVAALGAWRFMDNLSGAKSPMREQLQVAKDRQTWVMSFLYIGTFGSFIGYGAAMPLLMSTQFPEVSGRYAFLGALVGSLVRPVGGLLADRWGGARITAATFVAMGLGVLGVVWSVGQHAFVPFLAAFMLLFTLAGIGNGTTYRMIPAIFRARHGDSEEDRKRARTQSAAALGVISAVGAYGGFLIPRSFGISIASSGGIEAALYGFVVFYAVCAGLTWWCYLRSRVLVTRLPSLAHAQV
ncbi:MAG TPA: MFS transporter [Nocardioidaceae bacterium]|nr:MFS transporter [Nocardioidaceae bacterium]